MSNSMFRGCRARWRLVVCASLIVLAGATGARAHVEDTPFLEHPPKTAFGLLTAGSSLAIREDRFAWTATPFVEYAPFEAASLGVALPWGVLDGEVLLSDLTVAAKARLPVEPLTVVPSLGVEIPTGSDGATSGHFELVPTVFLERMLASFHLFGQVGGRFALEGDDHGHEDEDVNLLAPHTDREVFAVVGAAWFATSSFGLDARVRLFLEDLEVLVPAPEVGVVYQATRADAFTFKASLGVRYATAGVREGVGVGLSLYVSPE